MEPDVRVPMVLGKLNSLDDLFEEYNFFSAHNGRYLLPRWTVWVPLIGLPGSIDVVNGVILYARMRPNMAWKVQEHCLNGVVLMFTIHRSARNMKSDTMLVRGQDVLRQFDVAQVPFMENDACQAFFDHLNEKQT